MWIEAWDPQIKVFVPSGLPPHSNDSCYSIWGWLQLKWSFRMLFFLFFSYRVGEIMRCLWMYNDLCMFVNCRIIYANTCYIWMIHITFSLNTYMWVHQLQHLPWKKHLFFFLPIIQNRSNQPRPKQISFVCYSPLWPSSWQDMDLWCNPCGWMRSPWRPPCYWTSQRCGNHRKPKDWW